MNRRYFSLLHLKNKKSPSGFTLIELILVIAIIGVLFSIIVSSINPASTLTKARNATRLVDQHSMQTALSVYAIDNGEYPDVERLAACTDSDNPCPICKADVETEDCHNVGGVDFSSLLVNGKYLTVLPSDPSASTGTFTGYTIYTTSGHPHFASLATESGGHELPDVPLIYVADYTAGRVKLWNGFTWGFVGSDAGLTGPAGVAVASDGTVYTSDADTAQVKEWTGSSWVVLGSGLVAPRGLAVASDGTLYVADYSAGRVKEWTGSSWVNVGSALGNPFTVAVADDGTLYVADNTGGQVKRWTGSVWSSVGSGLSNPYGVTVAPDDTLYMADVGDHQVKQWTGSSWINIGSGLNNPWGVAVADDGTLYAADIAAHQVKQWTGSAWEPIGSGLSGPMGIYIKRTNP